MKQVSLKFISDVTKTNTVDLTTLKIEKYESFADNLISKAIYFIDWRQWEVNKTSQWETS